MITTRGFRDVLEMRRRDRRRTWGLWGDFVPIADRDLRLEVDERTLADGTIYATGQDGCRCVRPRQSLHRRGAQALAIIFINAYANATNEQEALAAATEVWPNQHICASHQVLPEIREFERSSTTALNAYLQPVVGAYLARLEQALAEGGFSGQFQIVQSNGGIMSTATARRLPVRTALSGPAGWRDCGGGDRVRCGLSGCDHLRSRRHVVRRFGDRRRQGVARGADHGRFRARHSYADDRDHDHRRRRRLDRVGRSRRPAAGRPGERGLDPGAGVLRPGQ